MTSLEGKPRKVGTPNSTKIPLLAVLLKLCEGPGKVTVPEVVEELRLAGYKAGYAAVSMALMRYAKQGQISRTRAGRWYQYGPNGRTMATLEFLLRSEAAYSEIDEKIRYVEGNILSGDISPTRGKSLGLLLTTGYDKEVVPERIKRILQTLGLSVALLPATEDAGDAVARDQLDELMNQIVMMTVTHDYSDPMMSAVLKAIPAVHDSIERSIPKDAKYLVTIYFLLERIQKGNLNASN